MMLRSGMIDMAIAGGAEACITHGTFRGWERLRVMATSDVCRPFDSTRQGMVIGEGGAALVLETRAHAEARGAIIQAELVGFCLNSDAHNIVQPSQEGAARAMRGALKDACLAPESVDYINAHGTGTPQNDPVETLAIRQVFGDHADQLAVSSTKSMHGHLLGGAAALEAVAVIEALRRQQIPPTMGLREPAAQCDLDYVPNEVRPASLSRTGGLDIAASNAFAFGGLNAVLIFRREQA